VPSAYHETLRDADYGILVLANAAGDAVMGFSSKRQKPDFHFPSKPQSAPGICCAMAAGVRERAAAKIARRDAAKAAPNPLEVGDVLCARGATIKRI